MKRLLLPAFIALSIACSAQKQKQKIDTVVNKSPEYYSLVGLKQNFQLLNLLIMSPNDVTPNQREALGAWLNKNTQRVTIKDSAAVKNPK